MRLAFHVYLIISVLVLLCLSFFDIRLTILFIFLTLIVVYNRRYIQTETTNTKTHYVEADESAKSVLFHNSTVEDIGSNYLTKYLVNSFFDTPSIMWNKKSRSVSNSKVSPIAKPMARMKLNSTMPVLSTSPMSTRLRSSRKNLNGSITSPAGPLLSSPFIPQIKRAMGLAPDSETKHTRWVSTDSIFQSSDSYIGMTGIGLENIKIHSFLLFYYNFSHHTWSGRGGWPRGCVSMFWGNGELCHLYDCTY